MDASKLSNNYIHFYLEDDPDQDFPFNYQFQLVQKSLVNMRNKKLHQQHNQYNHHHQHHNGFLNNQQHQQLQSNYNNGFNTLNHYNQLLGNSLLKNQPQQKFAPNLLNNNSVYTNPPMFQYQLPENQQYASQYPTSAGLAGNGNTPNTPGYTDFNGSKYYRSSSSATASSTPTASTTNFNSSASSSSILFAPRPLNSQYSVNLVGPANGSAGSNTAVNPPSLNGISNLNSSTSSPVTSAPHQYKNSPNFDAFFSQRPNSTISTFVEPQSSTPPPGVSSNGTGSSSNSKTIATTGFNENNSNKSTLLNSKFQPSLLSSSTPSLSFNPISNSSAPTSNGSATFESYSTSILPASVLLKTSSTLNNVFQNSNTSVSNSLNITNSNPLNSSASNGTANTKSSLVNTNIYDPSESVLFGTSSSSIWGSAGNTLTTSTTASNNPGSDFLSSGNGASFGLFSNGASGSVTNGSQTAAFGTISLSANGTGGSGFGIGSGSVTSNSGSILNSGSLTNGISNQNNGNNSGNSSRVNLLGGDNGMSLSSYF